MYSDQRAEDRQGRVTVHDVAAAAGVSKSTVSRILDERLPRSESDTAKRVRQVAEELGYMRDVAAASLRRGKTSTIGVVVPRLTDTVMAMLYEAIAHACVRAGQFAIVATTDDEPEAGRAAAQSLLQRGVDGLILSTARLDDDFPEELSARGVPFVLALRTTWTRRTVPRPGSPPVTIQPPRSRPATSTTFGLVTRTRRLVTSRFRMRCSPSAKGCQAFLCRSEATGARLPGVRSGTQTSRCGQSSQKDLKRSAASSV